MTRVTPVVKHPAVKAHIERFDDDTFDEWDERAAIIEYSVPGIARDEAEVEAYQRVCARRGIEPVVAKQMRLQLAGGQ